jgi:hypothetical protein
MKIMLALAAGALLSTTVSAFAVPTIQYTPPGGKVACNEQIYTSSNSAAFIEGAAVTNHVLVATINPKGDACASPTAANYGEGFIGTVKPSGTVIKNGAFVAGYSATYKLHYITVISWPLPAVGGSGTLDVYLSNGETGKNGQALVYGGKMTYKRTQ